MTHHVFAIAKMLYFSYAKRLTLLINRKKNSKKVKRQKIQYSLNDRTWISLGLKYNRQETHVKIFMEISSVDETSL